MKRIIATALVCMSTNATAFDFFDNTHLVSISQGTALTSKADALRSGSFEMADGSIKDFDKWYKPNSDWTDTRVDFVTAVTRSMGITWGISTGEEGRKYRIDPSFRLGFISAYQITKSATFTVRGYNTWGGTLREKACTADYGEIGGVQKVNCRMAASTLPPAETLQYLIKDRPLHRWMVSVDLNVNF